MKKLKQITEDILSTIAMPCNYIRFLCSRFPEKRVVILSVSGCGLVMILLLIGWGVIRIVK